MFFKIQYGKLKYQVKPFSLINAPVIFQDYINKILAKKFNIFIIIYFNNFFIYIESKKKEYIKVV